MLDSQLILADSFDPYKLVYERCLVFNPGSFQRRIWSVYHPHMSEIKERMEERCVSSDVPAIMSRLFGIGALLLAAPRSRRTPELTIIGFAVSYRTTTRTRVPRPRCSSPSLTVACPSHYIVVVNSQIRTPAR